jgi:hypothetical protein
MRVGQNPAKFVDHVAQPRNVTIAIVTYIPFLGGYYEQGLQVLKACLESLWANTDLPYDLLVFDNASCPEVRQYLEQQRQAGRIQFLVLSEQNVGKGGAWNFIFGAAPGEYVAYADSDVYFYPGWLPALLDVVRQVPNVGMVTGMPLLNPEAYSTSTVRWAQDHPQARLERSRLLSWEDYWRHAGTLGNDESRARAFYEEHPALRLTYQGQTCYVGAGHFQFLAPRRVLQAALPIPSERPMGQVRALDEAINRLGYLRLSTPQWWVQHLGNTLDGWQPPGGQAIRAAPARASRRSRIWQWKPLRRLLTFIYERAFALLYRN